MGEPGEIFGPWAAATRRWGMGRRTSFRRTFAKLFRSALVLKTPVMKQFLLTSTFALAIFFSAMPRTACAEPRERHPEIHAAIHSLEKAIQHLREANHDFGGHREAAIHASEEALNQLRLALESDRR